MLGLSTWALVESITGIKQVTTFWTIEEALRDQNLALFTLLVAFLGLITVIQVAITTLSQVIPLIGTPPPGGLNFTSEAVAGLVTGAEALGSVVSSGNSTAASLYHFGVQGFDNIRSQYEPPSLHVQDTIFPAIFGTFYALLVVLALLALVLLALERPRVGGAFLLMLWIWLIVMMFAGPGILNVAQHVADDSCLYFESYIYRTINESDVANAVKSAATAGLNYYVGLNTSATPQQIADEVFGINLTAVIANVTSIPQINQTLAYFSSPAGIDALRSAVNSTISAATIANLQQANMSLGQLTGSYDGLLGNFTRPRYIPVYRQFKDLFCCNLTHTMQLVWASWTASATTSGVLGLLLIWLLICVKKGYGRHAASSHGDSVMVVDDDLPPPKAEEEDKNGMYSAEDAVKHAV